ncbi:MAG: phosphoadenosine phosphosulfate reductase [Lentisphaerae bacterium GWF2_45_14]|nr:MAG: phosphoadenosine phosphosulfate reductase [Lentisphaerae bacterium GWF2_45_14]
MRSFKNLPPEEILRLAADYFRGKLAFASSFGLEDQVITDMISKGNLDIPIFTIDTGRLFNETYDLIEKTEKYYRVKVSVYFPASDDIENMSRDFGMNSFYEDEDKRRYCCMQRKVKPLQRALMGLSAWICGLRREQSMARGAHELIEWDEGNQIIKINPVADWSNEDVLKYIAEKKVPYNPLHDKGFASIGCACCTRAVKPGEHPRSGRWWWESPEHKECGLHLVNGRLERISKLNATTY